MTQLSGYDALMHELCVDLGWCGGLIDGRPSHVDDYIPVSGLVSAAQFIDWLLKAEGFGPETHPERYHRWHTQLRPVFVRHMGGDIVDAQRLQWSNVSDR